MKPRAEDPQGAQIAAHEEYLVSVRALREAEEAGDAAAARRLRRHAERAKTRWHTLVRAATRAMRETRHAPGGRSR